MNRRDFELELVDLLEGEEAPDREDRVRRFLDAHPQERALYEESKRILKEIRPLLRSAEPSASTDRLLLQAAYARSLPAHPPKPSDAAPVSFWRSLVSRSWLQPIAGAAVFALVAGSSYLAYQQASPLYSTSSRTYDLQGASQQPAPSASSTPPPTASPSPAQAGRTSDISPPSLDPPRPTLLPPPPPPASPLAAPRSPELAVGSTEEAKPKSSPRPKGALAEREAKEKASPPLDEEGWRETGVLPTPSRSLSVPPSRLAEPPQATSPLEPSVRAEISPLQEGSKDERAGQKAPGATQSLSGGYQGPRMKKRSPRRAARKRPAKSAGRKRLEGKVASKGMQKAPSPRAPREKTQFAVPPPRYEAPPADTEIQNGSHLKKEQDLDPALHRRSEKAPIPQKVEPVANQGGRLEGGTPSALRSRDPKKEPSPPTPELPREAKPAEPPFPPASPRLHARPENESTPPPPTSLSQDDSARGRGLPSDEPQRAGRPPSPPSFYVRRSPPASPPPSAQASATAPPAKTWGSPQRAASVAISARTDKAAPSSLQKIMSLPSSTQKALAEIRSHLRSQDFSRADALAKRLLRTTPLAESPALVSALSALYGDADQSQRFRTLQADLAKERGASE